MNCAALCEDSRTRDELGLELRPLSETLADTVRWLVEVGHLTHAKCAASRRDERQYRGGGRLTTQLRPALDR